MIKETSKIWMYEAIVDCFEFFIWPILEHKVTKDDRENYKLEVIKGLEEYVFIKRSKKDPLHPDSMLLKKDKKIVWPPLDYNNPRDVVRCVLTILRPYYAASTQNRVKRKLEENL